MDLKNVMAANLRRIRHDRDITQEELASLTGLSARYIGSIERARVSASVTILGRIAQALAVDPGELLRASCEAPVSDGAIADHKAICEPSGT
ncbi:transcriptional regulator [Gluconobacter oxydans]|uniref:helix-turn-helix domain-containing protein n=1 Tax=Gluconobacter thailandicus TaxID=257438 RepID=UPI0002995EF0|nr:helix-turn-helix transcriptional regulator [Gluconobacter thailandicus]AFW01339.1 transcriptional regulator [Gluconobacter oxydans H24]ANQ40060.1 transcriptional regulator [Gluconobacter oxydans]